MITVCKHCEAEFKTRRSVQVYCSRLCYAESRIGHLRPEHGLKMNGDSNPNWRGGRRLDKDGYVLIHTPGHPFCDGHGYVREHRLAMEKVVKRFLDPLEVVHHINEIPSDNRIKNLQLMTKAEHDALPGHFNDHIK